MLGSRPAMQDPSGVNKQLYDMFGWFNIPVCNIDMPVHLNIKVYLSDSISMRQRLNDLAITLIRNMFSLRCNVTHTFRVTRFFNFFSFTREHNAQPLLCERRDRHDGLQL